MKMPRVSTGMLMAIVFVAAFDCVTVGSILARPGALTGSFKLGLVVFLPMANLLAVGMMVMTAGARMAGDRRTQRISSLLMVVVAVLPAIVTEGVLRREVDPMTVRHLTGSEAVLESRFGNGWRVKFRDGSASMIPNGTRVRIDDDSRPATFAVYQFPSGEQHGDQRIVQITLLDGDRNGESVGMPKLFLRAIR